MDGRRESLPGWEEDLKGPDDGEEDGTAKHDQGVGPSVTMVVMATEGVSEDWMRVVGSARVR